MESDDILVPTWRSASDLMWEVLARYHPAMPAERQASASVIEITPEGASVTYGLGVSLMKMRDPAAARACVSVT